MRLIEADDVKKMISDTFEKEKDVINSFWKMGTLMDKVDEIQTAYNVDAVVERLEKEKQTSTSAKAEAIIGMCGASANHYGGEECAYQRAIEIVKGGGVDAKTDS